MSKQEHLMRAWLQAPHRWQQLWDACQQGAGRYTRGVFVVHGKKAQPPRLKTQGQLIADILKSEPIGYLS